MQTIDIESLIKHMAPVSPDREYSLAWSSGGTIGIRELKDNGAVLSFRENRGTIIKAGFSPDMRQIIAVNEDGTVSIWFTKDEIDGEACRYPENIVLFMSAREDVPYLNIDSLASARKYTFSLRDIRWAQYDYYDWGDISTKGAGR